MIAILLIILIIALTYVIVIMNTSLCYVDSGVTISMMGAMIVLRSSWHGASLLSLVNNSTIIINRITNHSITIALTFIIQYDEYSITH